MKINCKWNEALQFTNQNATGQTVLIDAKKPVGREMGPTPKELLVMGLCGCSGMDVISLLRLHKQNVQSFETEATVESSPYNQHPVVFLSAHLIFKVSGVVDPDILKHAVLQSQTKDCGVSAMLVKAFPIRFTVILNDEIILTGEPDFSGE